MSDTTTDSNIASISDITKRIASGEETDRAMCAAGLLNVFNAAIVKIGNRSSWTHADFMAYGTALAALDSIEPATTTDYSGRRADGRTAVSAALNKLNNA